MILSTLTKDQPFLYFSYTEKKDSTGFKIFLLQLINGAKVVDQLHVISGSPAAQSRSLIHPSKDFSGSGNPIPEGVYSVGQVIKMTAPEKGVGYVKIPLEFLNGFRVNNRGEFLFHDDPNRTVARGSLGCIVSYNSKDMNRIVGWCSQKARPDILIVDYKVGLLASKNISVQVA